MSIKNNITSLQNLLETVNALPDAGGIELPELTNEGSASDLLSGKELIDDEGNVITGIFSLDTELSAQDDLIAQIQAAVDNLPEAGCGEPTLQSKTVTPSTSSQTVTADSGYDGLNTVTVNAIPSTYVKPTSTKAATIYTPTTSNQTIAAGTYCSGVQTIKGDANLVADNIKSGVSIFGVAGSYESSGIQYEIVTIPAGSNSVAYTLPRVTHAFGSAPLHLEVVNSMFGPYTNSVVSIRNNSAYYVYNLEYDTMPEYIEVEFNSCAVTYSNGILTIDQQNGIMFDVQVLLVNDPTASQISLPS